ncbi:hypothetical protein [Halobacillus sp. BBL2006]|uniref:hypothetical protein n=1 Tax=Halobacillus sp. BBL2006 TaxID=1543706 RepID=UPI0006918808|nr:hypothetical protein [Halobacillus sp. BBL2006]
MVQPITLWLDDENHLGVVELEDRVFGTSFHPVQCTSKVGGSFQIINYLWYTTYTGARHYFRAHTNSYTPAGRMKKVNPELCVRLERGR